MGQFSRVSVMLVWTLFALGATACDHSRMGTAAGTIAPETGATLKVTNDNFYDVAVYAVRSGVPARLGTVMANRTELIRIDPSYIATSQLAIVAAPIGSRGVATTGTLLVRPGDEIDFRVGTVLSQSTTIIR